MTKLLVTYFDGTADKREVLQLIAKMLNWTEEERRKVRYHSHMSPVCVACA